MRFLLSVITQYQNQSPFYYDPTLKPKTILIVTAIVIVTIAFYVVRAIAFQRALKHLKYKNDRAAWIPFYDLYVFANLIENGDCTTTILKDTQISTTLFNFWWAFAIFFNVIPVLGQIAMLVLLVICYGTCFIKIYAKLENKPESKTKFIGYLSSIIWIIPIAKFLKLPKETK